MSAVTAMAAKRLTRPRMWLRSLSSPAFNISQRFWPRDHATRPQRYRETAGNRPCCDCGGRKERGGAPLQVTYGHDINPRGTHLGSFTHRLGDTIFIP